jgi:hypothetical protein
VLATEKGGSWYSDSLLPWVVFDQALCDDRTVASEKEEM